MPPLLLLLLHMAVLSLFLLQLYCLDHLRNASNSKNQILACCPCRRLFQAALSGMACDYVTASDVDQAFPPGQGIPDSFQRCPLLYMLFTYHSNMLHHALLACTLYLAFTKAIADPNKAVCKQQKLSWHCHLVRLLPFVTRSLKSLWSSTQCNIAYLKTCSQYIIYTLQYI